MPSDVSPTKPLDADRLIYGGLLGLAVAGTLQLFDKKLEESIPLTVALFAFTGSIPLLAGSLLVVLSADKKSTRRSLNRWTTIIGLSASAISVIGLASLLVHVGWIYGGVFFVSIIITILLVRLQ